MSTGQAGHAVRADPDLLGRAAAANKGRSYSYPRGRCHIFLITQDDRIDPCLEVLHHPTPRVLLPSADEFPDRSDVGKVALFGVQALVLGRRAQEEQELNDRRGEWSWREDDDLGAGGGEVLQD